MADFTIEAKPRTVTGKKVGVLRRAGFVPISVYGPSTAAESLQVPYRALEIALMNAGGTNLIDLKVEGGKTHVVLAREVQRDVLKGTIMHVDFFAVDMNQTIRAEIPIHYIGESPIVEARQAILITGPNTLTVEVLPDKIRNYVEVDLSGLEEIGDTVYVHDLDLGEGVMVINDPDELLAGARQTSAARAELLEADESEEEEEIEEGAEPEVIGRGREEDEEEEE